LANEVSALSKLHDLSERFITKGQMQPLLDEIVKAAIEIAHADRGNMQLLDANNALRIVSNHGFNKPFLNFFNHVDIQSTAVCGKALKTKKRVIVEDITNNPIFANTPALKILLDADVRAVQSTPLLTRSGRFLGVISTHYRIPYRPDESDLRLLDFLARQAADFVERMENQQKLEEYAMNLEKLVEERTADLLKLNYRLKKENGERLRTEQSLRLEEARLDALLQLSQIGEATLEHITSFTLEQAIALTSSKIGFLGFPNENETVYTLHAVSKDFVKECNVTGVPVQWHVIDAGIWADAIREHRTLFVNDYSKPHPRKKGFPPGHPYVKKFMVVPILEGKRIVAIAGVGNKVSDYDRSDERQVVLLLRGMWNYVQKAEAELRAKNAERLATIGQTAGMVGHDIRNPLQAIVGDLYLAFDDLGSIADCEEKERVKESLLAIQRNVDYINKIVSDLQDFVRPLKPTISEVDLEGLVEELLLKADLPENIQAYCRVKVDAKAVKSDAAFLERVLGNLISNAVQAMPDGGEFSVHAYADADDVVISVQDTGVGVPEELKDKLFTPLFTTKSKGQGFGLAVVKRLVESLGGSVSFESEVGNVTKFIVRLPMFSRAKFISTT
jgi:signal transduction histidine kinase